MSRQPGKEGKAVSGTGWRRWAVLAAVLAAVFCSADRAVMAGDAAAVLTEEAQECLECHEDESLEKDLTDGETLSLNVDGGIFQRSVHASLGCTGCHLDIVLEDHPEERAVGSRREHRRRISKSCGNCHSAGRPGEGPAHAALVSQAEAPACAACHASHALESVEEWKASLDDTAYCLTCHSKSIRTTLGNGLSFALTVDETQLRGSVHMDHECADCHQDFGKDDHLVRDFAGKREHSLALTGVCRECHEEMYEQYEGSIHYSMLERGNLEAPVCTDCHGSHFVNPVATLETIAGVPCRRCHQEIFDSYSQSMHGQARGSTGHLDAPICADCHLAHGVRAASWTERFKEACLSCHDGLEEVHSAWLPNAGLHLDAVACPSCHAPEAQRRIDLVLFDRAAGRPVTAEDLRAHLGKQSAPGAGQADSVLSAGDLWRYIRESNRAGKGGPIVLEGQLEVRTGLEAHQMTSKGGAVNACATCHLKGAEAFETVTMSLVDSDGHVRHVLIDEKVLGSITSVGSLGGFYALGSTRIRILDILLILAVLGGMSVPALHMTARLLARQRGGRQER